MAQAFSTAQPGLFLDPNPLMAPPGALAAAENCIIRDLGILESRRGFALQSAKSNLQALGSFGGKVVAADPTGGHAYYFDSGSWHDMGAISAPTVVTNPRNQFFQSQKALYVTSGTGLQRTDVVTNPLQLAGLIRAKPFGTFSISFSTTLGTNIPNGSAVAYCTVYQRQVGALFDILSPPSAPITAINSSGSAATPQVTVPFGPQLAVGDLVQVYRTVTAASGIPSAEFFLVQSIPVTSANHSAGFFTFIDQVPDTGLGVSLYTDASQEGAGQENDPPPLSGDVCQFLGTTIYANTQGYQTMSLTLSGVGTSNGVNNRDTLTFNVGSNIVLTAGTDFSINTIATALQTLADAINGNATLKTHMQASAFIALNTVILEAVGPTIPSWTLTIGSTLNLFVAGTIITDTVPPLTKFLGPLVPGAQFNLAPVSTPDANFPAGTYTIVSLGGGVDKYNNSLVLGAGVATTKDYFISNAYPWLAWTVTGQLTTTPGQYLSSNSTDPAGLSFSKFQQPEAVPLENSLTVGDPSLPILRILPLRQSVLIFKGGDGIWQLTGTDPTTFTATPYDLTTQIAQPWSAAAIADTVCFVSTKGPLGIGESGGAFPLAPSGYDTPIREEILKILTFAHADATIGIGYESEKDYILWTPSTNADTQDKEAWIFNLANAAWTRWPLASQAGFINPTDNKLYYTDGTDVFVERKDYADTDYQDIGGTCTISSVSGAVVTTSPALIVGDFLTQGGASGWVVSTAGSAATLIGVVGTFTAASATFQRAITCTVTGLPWAGSDRNPGLNHRFQEVAYNFREFGAPFLDINTTTSLNVVEPNVYTVFPTANSYGVNLRKGMNPNNTQAILLQTGFTYASALTNFQLQSTSLVDEPVSTRTAGG